ncbi:hypothetical protein M514_12646 [Trichuris suis]|uniref:Tudor domain-containing protein n=1 Tax=Trichuris suis TaxID=68888 RepID=A0A085LNC7_9BILA|nr:hypothetical protein M513_12646 [Trichuris suis]KFD64106.1 hypothetical protein M514_12646 [Trichuris suis]KHJ45393.1 tudor domain protein [Trichuris suis]
MCSYWILHGELEFNLAISWSQTVHELMATISSNNGRMGASRGHYANGDIDRALSSIEFNMADVELSEYVLKPNLCQSPSLRWKPRKRILEDMFAFYKDPHRKQLLALEKELIFKGQLIAIKRRDSNAVRCIVENPPDAEGNLSVLTIDHYTWIENPEQVYFLYCDFAACLPPWLVRKSSRPPYVWPDRYSLPSIRHRVSEFGIATEKFRKFRKSPSLETHSSIGVMVRITKVHQPNLFIAKPVDWMKQSFRFRELLENFYDTYKEEFRLNASLLRVGLPVAFRAYGEWHRGEVLSLPGSLGLMDVLYLDEGYIGQVRCDKVYHLAVSFTKYEIGLIRIKLAGLLPPPDGWPKRAYEYVEDACLDKDLFLLITHQDDSIYEGYLSHGPNSKTMLRSLCKERVNDNLVESFGAISLASGPFEQEDDE